MKTFFRVRVKKSPFGGFYLERSSIFFLYFLVMVDYADFNPILQKKKLDTVVCHQRRTSIKNIVSINSRHSVLNIYSALVFMFQSHFAWMPEGGMIPHVICLQHKDD